VLTGGCRQQTVSGTGGRPLPGVERLPDGWRRRRGSQRSWASNARAPPQFEAARFETVGWLRRGRGCSDGLQACQSKALLLKLLLQAAQVAAGLGEAAAVAGKARD